MCENVVIILLSLKSLLKSLFYHMESSCISKPFFMYKLCCLYFHLFMYCHSSVPSYPSCSSLTFLLASFNILPVLLLFSTFNYILPVFFSLFFSPSFQFYSLSLLLFSTFSLHFLVFSSLFSPSFQFSLFPHSILLSVVFFLGGISLFFYSFQYSSPSHYSFLLSITLFLVSFSLSSSFLFSSFAYLLFPYFPLPFNSPLCPFTLSSILLRPFWFPFHLFPSFPFSCVALHIGMQWWSAAGGG